MPLVSRSRLHSWTVGRAGTRRTASQHVHIHWGWGEEGCCLCSSCSLGGMLLVGERPGQVSKVRDRRLWLEMQSLEKHVAPMC